MAQRRDAGQLAHARVQVLGVVALLADLGRVPDGGQPVQRVGRAERQVQAEERVPVARAGSVVARAGGVVQADRHLHPDRAEVAMVGFQPAVQPAGHHAQHAVVDRGPAGGVAHPAQPGQPGGAERDRPAGVDVPVERGPVPRLRCLAGRRPEVPERVRAARRGRGGRGGPVCAGAGCRGRRIVPEHRAGHRHRGHPVGQCVVDAPDHRAAAAGQPGYHVDPPQRP